mgnify:CR=1 FL=1
MNQSDAANVASYLTHMSAQGLGSQESRESLLRVVTHLNVQIERMNQPLFNPSAFPVDYVPGVMNGEPGMSLRDYFAAKALQGLLANPGCDYTPMTATAQAQSVADAYGLADAMLKERDK